MGKKLKKNVPVSSQGAVKPVAESLLKAKKNIAWYNSLKVQAAMIAVIAFLCYFNTTNNEYALDDNIIILKNEFVYEGFAGIPGILTHDAFYSYCKQTNSENQLAGGRYRPLSIITFAIEQQFLGAIPPDQIDSVVNHAGNAGPQQDKLVHDMKVRHWFNVLLFIFSVVTLLYFLHFVVFGSQPLIAFIATLLFVAHPIHTEVVANVKSRDEILSLLFICLTFIMAFKFRELKKMWLLALGLICYFLALLSKEYAISLVFLLPLSFVLFDNDSLKKSIAATLPYFGVAIIYLLIRFSVVGFVHDSTDSDVWNNPYVLATGTEKLATEIATSLNYLRLLVFPYPLSSDYSYNAIPYKTFAHPLVWLSLVVHAGLLAAFIYFLRRNKILAFGIAVYLLNLAMVCNIFYDIGGTLGERLIYHSSLGFVIVAAYLLYRCAGSIKPELLGKIALAGTMVVILILGSIEIIKRNADWKNDLTLYSKDIKVVPNSLLVNANLGVAYINKADLEKDTVLRNTDLQKGIVLLNKAVEIHNTCLPAYVNRGLAYFRLGQPDSAQANYDKLYALIPGYAPLPGFYYNLGVYYFLHQRYKEAKLDWERTLQLDPNYSMARNALDVLAHGTSTNL